MQIAHSAGRPQAARAGMIMDVALSSKSFVWLGLFAVVLLAASLYEPSHTSASGTAADKQCVATGSYNCSYSKMLDGTLKRDPATGQICMRYFQCSDTVPNTTIRVVGYCADKVALDCVEDHCEDTKTGMPVSCSAPGSTNSAASAPINSATQSSVSVTAPPLTDSTASSQVTVQPVTPAPGVDCQNCQNPFANIPKDQTPQTDNQNSGQQFTPDTSMGRTTEGPVLKVPSASDAATVSEQPPASKDNSLTTGSISPDQAARTGQTGFDSSQTPSDIKAATPFQRIEQFSLEGLKYLENIPKNVGNFVWPSVPTPDSADSAQSQTSGTVNGATFASKELDQNGNNALCFTNGNACATGNDQGIPKRIDPAIFQQDANNAIPVRGVGSDFTNCRVATLVAGGNCDQPNLFASPYLPLGTMVTVCGPNQTCVDGIIGDVGPNLKYGRIIDLSPSASCQIGICNDGVGATTVYVKGSFSGGLNSTENVNAGLAIMNQMQQTGISFGEAAKLYQAGSPNISFGGISSPIIPFTNPGGGWGQPNNFGMPVAYNTASMFPLPVIAMTLPRQQVANAGLLTQ